MSAELDRPVDLPPDLAQVHDDLERARRAEGSHYLWSMVALSPVGIFLLVAAFREGTETLLWAALLALAAAVQFRQWKRWEREVQRLEGLLGEGDRELST